MWILFKTWKYGTCFFLCFFSVFALWFNNTRSKLFLWIFSSDPYQISTIRIHYLDHGSHHEETGNVIHRSESRVVAHNPHVFSFSFFWPNSHPLISSFLVEFAIVATHSICPFTASHILYCLFQPRSRLNHFISGQFWHFHSHVLFDPYLLHPGDAYGNVDLRWQRCPKGEAALQKIVCCSIAPGH
jgi:hypothetical protein